MRYILIVIALTLCLGGVQVEAAGKNKDRYSIKPRTNKGQKWRIGYLEGGPYSNYPINLKALLEAFEYLGRIEKLPTLPIYDENDTKKLWRWMGRHVKSKYIEFLANAYWSSNWDDKKLRKLNLCKMIKRLKYKRDIDLMPAMGTWAGQDLATNKHKTPVVVMSTSNLWDQVFYDQSVPGNIEILLRVCNAIAFSHDKGGVHRDFTVLSSLMFIFIYKEN